MPLKSGMNILIHHVTLGLSGLLLCGVAWGDPARVSAGTPVRREADPRRVELQPVVQCDVAYGNGTDQVGATESPQEKAVTPAEDISACGPESFCCDPDGRLLVADTLHGRVQIFSSEGAYLRSIPLADRGLCSDLATDETGNVIVFDESSHRLGCYSAAGDVLSTLTVARGLWKSRGPLHRVGQFVYTVADDQRDVLLAAIRNGVLAPVDAGEASDAGVLGVHGADGRRYLIELDRFRHARVQAFDGDSLVSVSELPLTGVVSARFLEALADGRFFVQTERLGKGEGVILAVHAFGRDGTLLASSDLPENDYERWSVKLLSVDPAGVLWQAIPSQGRLKLRAFVQAR